MPSISERVAQIRTGEYPTLVCRMKSGWAVMAEKQVLPGYCLLLPDPVVSSLNDLTGQSRADYLDDMAALGDAVLKVTGALRINYEILCNVVPELHAHVFPRFTTEPEDLRLKPVWSYDWDKAPRYSAQEHGGMQEQIRAALLAARGE